MPKILRIINRFNLGGPTYNAAYLSKYMPADYETMLVGGEKDDTEATSLFIVNQLGIEPTIIPTMKRSLNFTNDYSAYNKIKELIKEFKPDIVHTHASKAGFLGRLAAHNLNVPIILHTFHGHVFHSYFNSASTLVYKNLERYMAKRSHGIIAISERQKHELAHEHKICPEDKIKVIPLGFDLDKFQTNMDEKRKSFRERYNIDDDEIAIVIIGRLVPIKNHNLFIEAIKKVNEKTSKKIRAFIVGDGEERNNLEEKAKSLNLKISDGSIGSEKSTLTFTSWIKDADIANAGADIIALSSLNEGTPVSLIEAQAASNPIVSTLVGGIENVVIANETALLSEKNDLEGFTENLLKLIEDEDLRKKMSRLGASFVSEKFHYNRLINDMSTYYEELMKSKVKSKHSVSNS